MASARLDNEERRRQIVDAAMPLFARKGFAGTTTKEIAEAASVSEALVFKHFPSKAALYEEILKAGCLADPVLDRLGGLEASTASLVKIIHFMLRHFVFDGAEMETRHRLMLISFLDDGEYAQIVFDSAAKCVYPKFAECLEAARRAGDAAAAPGASENLFWFAQHVAATLAYGRLPAGGTVRYRGDAEAVVTEATAFVLRGLGLTDAVIRQHCPAPSDDGGRKLLNGETSRA